VGQQKRTMTCSRVGKQGGRLWGGIRGSSTCPLAANGGEKCRTIYVCISFLHAVVVVLVIQVSVIILIHFVVVIFSLHMYAQQARVFSALFTGVLSTIACICRRGVSGFLQLVRVYVWRLFPV